MAAMSALVSEIGNVYGRLIVIGRAFPNDAWGRARWRCQCQSCGVVSVILGFNLRRHRTVSDFVCSYPRVKPAHPKQRKRAAPKSPPRQTRTSRPVTAAFIFSLRKVQR